MFVKLSDNPWGTKQSHFVPSLCEDIWPPLRHYIVSLCHIVFVKLSDHHWGTKQSRFVPSCLWSYLTTIQVLNNFVPWGTKQSHFVKLFDNIEVLNSLTLSYRVCELSDNHWGTKQSHFVPSCLWSRLTTIEVLNISLCPIVFVKLSDHHWGTKQSHFVTSCLWSCLTTIEVLNSLTLSHRVCEVVWQPLRY